MGGRDALCDGCTGNPSCPDRVCGGIDRLGRVTAGDAAAWCDPARRCLMFDPDDLDPVTAAYHEAGHAFLAHRLGGRVVAVTIEDEDGALMGRTTVHWRDLDAPERRRCSGLVALAGPVAEVLWRGDIARLATLSAWRADWQEVQAALLAQVRGGGPAALLQRWLVQVRRELDGPGGWEQLCRIADALAAHGTLDEDLLAEVLDG